MSFRRVGWVAAILLITWLELSCGQIYRPVVIPINITPPNPANFHAVFSINANVGIDSQFSSIGSISESGTLVTVTLSAPLTNAVSGAPIQISGVGLIGYDGIFSISQVSGGGTTITYQDCSTNLTPAVGGTAVVLSSSTQSSSILSASESVAGLVTATLNAPLTNTTSGVPVIVSGMCLVGAMATGYDGDFFISQTSNSPPAISYQDPVLNLLPAVGGTAASPVPTATALVPGPSSFITSISESPSGLVTAALFPPLTNAAPGGPISISGVSLSGYDGNFSISQVSSGGSTITYQDPVLSLPPTSGGAANVPILNQGTAFQIDVSGDSDIGSANMGTNPTHAAILPNNSRVFVASAGGNLCPAGTDIVTAFAPASDSSTATGLGPPTTFTLPNVGAVQSANISAISEAGNLVTVTLSAPITTTAGSQIVISGVTVTVPGPPPEIEPSPLNGCFPITSVNGTTIQYVGPLAGPGTLSGGTASVPTFCRYIPVYLASSQNNAMYLANYGAEGDPNCNFASTDSVAYLNTTTNAIANIAYLPAASHPVAMVETFDTLNLYVLNQGSNSVTDLSPSDLSTLTTIPVGNTPAWAALRPDGQRLYVVTQGDGQLYTINTATNSVIPGSPQAVGGAGANFVLYDKSRNRLYVTNPSAGSVYIFDATTDPPSPVGSATGALDLALPPACTPTTCTAVMPSSVAALIDGTRFYVASYATACSQSNASGCVVPGPCPDGITAAGCVIPQVTVYDAGTLAVKTTIFPLLAAVSTTTTGLTSSPYALTPVTFCAPVFPYTPATTRFRMSAAASVDGSRVYASMCDGGSVAIVDTTTSTIATGVNTSDNLVTDLLAPFSAGQPQGNGEPLPQSPVFLLTGQ